MFGGVNLLTLAGTLTAVTLCTPQAPGAPSQQKAGAASAQEIGRADGDAEAKLLAELSAAEDAYADHGDPAQLDRELDAAFRRYGLDLEHVEPKTAGERIGRCGSAGEIAARIDQWCNLRRTQLNMPSWRRLAETARAADSRPLAQCASRSARTPR